jgi:hypothetical protein
VDIVNKDVGDLKEAYSVPVDNKFKEKVEALDLNTE